MPITQKWAYLDHAAVGPLSRPAAEAVRRYAQQAELEGDTVWPEWNQRVSQVRQAFAELISARPDEICLVPNTTTGINLVAEGWPWRPGDNIVLPEGEFPSNLFPWQNQRSRGVELRVAPRRDGRVDLDDLFQYVDDSTVMIALSWVGYASGFRVDLDELTQRAHDRGVLIFVDAIQGLGMYGLDCQKTPIDFLAADGHKWLLGPEGCGVAMIRADHLTKIRCGNVGWNSVENSFNYSQPEMKLRGAASRFESGSSNMVGAAALLGSLELFSKVIACHGPTAIGDRVVSLANQLNQGLLNLGASTRFPDSPSHQSGIVTFDVPWATPAEIRTAGLNKQVVVSCRDGGVRAAVHAYNDESDLQRLVDVVAELK